MGEFDGHICGKRTVNPMLAFGSGEAGRICSECKEFDMWDNICRKRIPYGTSRRRQKHHDGEWLACKHFSRPDCSRDGLEGDRNRNGK